MADLRWPPFENKTFSWRHMTSSSDNVDLKGHVFGRAICLLSFLVVALIFSELWGERGIRPPGPWSPNKKSPIWIGLNVIRRVVIDL